MSTARSYENPGRERCVRCLHEMADHVFGVCTAHDIINEQVRDRVRPTTQRCNCQCYQSPRSKPA